MLSTSALVDGATAINAAWTHVQIHSAAPGGSGTTAVVGSRVANTGSVNAAGVITRAAANFTGLPPNQGVTHVSYWSSVTGGVFKGSSALTGDVTANAAGEYTVSSITETPSAT